MHALLFPYAIGVGGWAFRLRRPLEADRVLGAAALYATRLLGSSRGSRARSGTLLRAFQNASISPSSLFSPRRTGNRPPCLPARLFLGILAVCAPDSRLRRQPTDHKTLFIPFFPYFSSFVWVRLGPGVRGRGGGDTGTGAGTGAGTSAGTGERCSAILNSVSWSVAAQLMQL